MSEKDNPTFDTNDGSSWRGSRGHVGADVSSAVPSYRQATTTYRAPAAPSDDRNSNPSYRVATDEIGVKQPRAGKPAASGGGGGGSASRMLILIVLCIALGIICIILLALAIHYGVAYQNALASGLTTPANSRVVAQDTSSTASVTTTTVPSNRAVTVLRSVLGQTEDGKDVTKYVLTNGKGVQVDLISIGARINALRVPSIQGTVDIVAGLNETNTTNFQHSFLGAVNGRVCSALFPSFTFNGQQFNLRTSGTTYTNGGSDGFYKKNYDSYVDVQSGTVHFLYNSSAGADGVQGSVWVHATYQLTADSELIVSMTLDTDAASPVDMCSSVGFNLCGAHKDSLIDNRLQLFTSTTAVTALGKEFNSVPATTYFQSENDVHSQVKASTDTFNDYDLAFRVGNRPTGKSLVASAKCSSNNVAVMVYSNQPAIRVFATSSGDPVDGKNGMNYTGTASYYLLQPQLYPVVVQGRTPDYANLMLSPTNQYRQETSFKLIV